MSEGGSTKAMNATLMGLAAVAATVFATGFTTGCAGRRATSHCAGGDCAEVPDCELGMCEGDEPLLVGGKTISSHSMAEGMTDESLNAECPFEQSEIPPVDTLLDDTSIPEFRRSRQRRDNHAQGQAFLQDHELHEHLLTVQGALFECLDLAACYELEAAGTGALDFQFELEPTGKVSAVSVSTSEELDQPIVRACARRSVYESRFPTWDGSRMVVDYSVQITEG